MTSEASLIDGVREVCLTFPEATERETWGHPTFRIGEKMFASCGTSEDGTVTMTAKVDRTHQKVLLDHGQPFFLPKYVGTKGWIGITVAAGTDWDEVRDIVDESYRLIAPKRCVRLLDADSADRT